MAISVTSDMVEIHDCDTADWSAGSVDDAYQDEGSGCLGVKISNALSPLYTYTLPSALDFTSKFLVQPLLVNGAADTKANGGYRVYMADGSGNNGTWYVGGSEDKEKWIYFAVDPSTTPTEGTGTIDVTDITAIGVQFKTVSIASGNASNCFWDISHYGSYIQVTSALTDNITWEDIAIASQANYWGVAIFNEKLGVTAVQGLIKLGSTVSGDVNINSTGETTIWQSSEFLPDARSGIEILGNSGTTTNVSLANGSVKGVTNFPYLDASDANIDDFTVSSYPITHFAAIDLESTSTVTGTTVDGCGLITPLTAVVEDSTISNSTETTGYALLLPQTNNVTRITYKDNYYGFGVNPATDGASFTEDGGTFSGNTADVYNIHATNAVTINASNGSNVATSATAGGVVTISNPFTFTFTVNPVISNYEYRLYTVTSAGSLIGAVEVQGLEDAVLSSYDYNYEYASDFVLAVQVLPHANDYEEVVVYFQCSNASQSQTINLTPDINN